MKSENVVRFRTKAGISQDLTQRLLEKGKPYGLTDLIPFEVEKINVAEWVRLKCRYGCNRYGTNWCCPPATPRPAKVRAILREYHLALLTVGSKSCKDFYLDNQRKRALQVKCWKGTLSMERHLFLEGYYKAFSLVGECCALCRQCAYPADCRFPQEKRPSIESFCIDVIGTLKNIGATSTVATNTRDAFNYYGLILLQ